MNYERRSGITRYNTILLFSYPGLEYIVFDTETTGKKESDYVVEFSAEKYRVTEGFKAEKIDEKDIFIKPPFLMDEEVIKIHGITNEFLEDKPDESEVFEDIRQFIGSNAILIGHNIDFDIGMMSRMYKRMGHELTYQKLLDTLEMTRDLMTAEDVRTTFEGRGKTKEEIKMLLEHPNTLSNAAAVYGLDEGITFHKSSADVAVTSRLLQTYIHEYREQNSTDGYPVPKYLRMYFYEGRNKLQKGTYVETESGRIYYSNFDKKWKSNDVDLYQIDINRFEMEILHRLGCDIKDLGKMTSSKFKRCMNS